MEGARVAASRRGEGVGGFLLEWMARASASVRQMVRFTDDERRSDALRFYESLGFEATREDMKLISFPDDIALDLWTLS